MSAPRNLLSIGFVLAALLALPGTATATRSDHRVEAALDGVVAAGAPGAAAVVNARPSVAGVADIETGRPFRSRDRIRIGSVTKSFTAVVALQLVGEGRLRLNDTVGELLPGVLPAADRVTLRQLLNHTSGVPDDLGPILQGVFGGDPLRIWRPRELVGLVRDKDLLFAPGTRWAYSNTEYVLAGLMIERATGRRLGRELERRIVRPLRLRDTSFPVRAARLGRDAARGYSLDVGPQGPIDGPLRDVTRYSPSFAWASGNGVSTVRDVARFYRGLLRGRLLSPRLLRAALETVSTGRPGRRYGLGLNVDRTPRGTLVGHDGDIPGFSVQARSSRDGRRQAVLAVNVKFGPPAVDDALDAAMDSALDAAFAGKRGG